METRWILECNHITSKVLDGKSYCMYCRRLYPVIRQAEDWHAYCSEPSCKFTAYTGAAMFECLRKGSRHARRKRNHTVQVIDPWGKFYTQIVWGQPDTDEVLF